MILNEGVRIDEKATNFSEHPLHGRSVDDDVCGMLVYMKGENLGRITLFESILSSSTLDIETGPDKTGYELVLIKDGQRAMMAFGASARFIRHP